MPGKRLFIPPLASITEPGIAITVLLYRSITFTPQHFPSFISNE